ncbi:Diamine acetyltransferase 1 [Asimina triloba]
MKFLVQSPSSRHRILYKQLSASIPHRNLHFSPPRAIALAAADDRQSAPMATCVDKCRNGAPKKSIYCDLDRPPIENSWCKFANFATCGPLVDVRPARSEKPDLWLKICDEARSDADHEPILRNYYHSAILCHNSLESALAHHLANKISNSNLPTSVLQEVFSSVFAGDGDIRAAVADDLRAAKERDPACISLVHCLLHFKGFLACQSHRVSHKLWNSGRKALALLLQSRASEAFAVDIHPGAKIGRGILLDHATGVVIGETAVVGDNVSILHSVTLGGTGKASGDRHPKIGNGVLIGAGTQILGNVRIGEGAKIGAGSVVLKDVPPRTTAVGSPARLVGGKENPVKLDKPPSFTMDHTSFINEWSDYVI